MTHFVGRLHRFAPSRTANANEVISNRAIEMLAGTMVPSSWSTRTTTLGWRASRPTTPIRRRCISPAEQVTTICCSALRHLHKALRCWPRPNPKIIKIGRTHTQDATAADPRPGIPSGHAQQPSANGIRRIEMTLLMLMRAGAGRHRRSATGLNLRPSVSPKGVAERSATITGLKFTFTAPQQVRGARRPRRDGILHQRSGSTRPPPLFKIANDNRLSRVGAALGPRRTQSPENEPGSRSAAAESRDQCAMALTMSAQHGVPDDGDRPGRAAIISPTSRPRIPITAGHEQAATGCRSIIDSLTRACPRDACRAASRWRGDQRLYAIRGSTDAELGAAAPVRCSRLRARNEGATPPRTGSATPPHAMTARMTSPATLPERDLVVPVQFVQDPGRLIAEPPVIDRAGRDVLTAHGARFIDGNRDRVATDIVPAFTLVSPGLPLLKGGGASSPSG